MDAVPARRDKIGRLTSMTQFQEEGRPLNRTRIAALYADMEQLGGTELTVAGWVRSIRDQCVAAGVAFLHKQWGGRTPKAGGRELDGRTWDEMPEVAHA